MSNWIDIRALNYFPSADTAQKGFEVLCIVRNALQDSPKLKVVERNLASIERKWDPVSGTEWIVSWRALVEEKT